MLADGDFANGIQELHSLLSLSKKDTAGLVDRRQPSAISQPRPLKKTPRDMPFPLVSDDRLMMWLAPTSAR
jgi:hypothetical protein